jgi:hypothetical protein
MGGRFRGPLWEADKRSEVNMLTDDLVDVALVVQGLRTAEESRILWELIAGRLRRALDSVRTAKPARRRDPGADHVVDWLYRLIVDAPLDDAARAEAEGLILDLKRLVGA